MPKNTPPRKDHNRVPRAPRPTASAEAEPREGERVAKVVARAGLGSRREIEEWILAGRVAVNGEVLESPARTVTEADTITVDGVPLPAKERTRLFLYHKPKGVVTTNFDPEGRPTLFEILPAGLPRLVSVGRLDLNTEGLILLTNDGGLSRVLELPETGWLRRYRVRAKGDITQDKLDALIAGITVDGVHYGPIEALLDRVQGANVWITLALREGKNREVRNVLGSLGLDVNRLIRLSYGPFQLGELAQGEVEEVRTRVLADQLGETLAAAAGADFEGPLFNHAEEDAPRRPAKARYAKAEGAQDRHRRLPIDTEPGEGKTVKAGLVADRKGRKVLVQRVRANETEAEEGSARPRRDDARGGERTFRRRPERPFAEPGEERPAREERFERPDRERPARSRDRKVSGPRPARPRAEAEGEGSERSFRPRNERAGGREERGERPERPFRERPPRRDGEEGGFRSRADRPERGDRSERPFRERAPRAEGERSYRGEGSDRPYSGRVKSEQSRFRSRRDEDGGERAFRPRREGDERPARRERPEGDRPFRERAPRTEGDRPARSFRPRPEGDERPPRRERPEGERSFRERGPRPEGDRPFRERTPRIEGERPARSFRPRPEGDERPARRERPEGERPFRERGPRPEGERPFRSRDERPAREDRAPRGERPASRSFGDKPSGGRSFGKGGAGKGGAGKSFGTKSYGAKNFADRPGGRPSGGKPGGNRSGGGKPAGGRPGGGKPGGGKPGGRPPRTPRS